MPRTPPLPPRGPATQEQIDKAYAMMKQVHHNLHGDAPPLTAEQKTAISARIIAALPR